MYVWMSVCVYGYVCDSICLFLCMCVLVRVITRVKNDDSILSDGPRTDVYHHFHRAVIDVINTLFARGSLRLTRLIVID